MVLEDYEPEDDLIQKCMDTIGFNSEAYITFYIRGDEVNMGIRAKPESEVMLRIAMYDYLKDAVEGI